MRLYQLTIRKDWIQYVFIYLLIASHGAQFYAANTEIMRYLIIGLCAVYMISNYRKIDTKLLYHMIGLAFFMGILMLVHFDRSYLDKGISLVEHICIFIVSFDISKEMFATRYIQLITLISSISLPFFIIQCIAPGILTMILKPTMGWGQGYSWATDFYGELLYTYRGTVAGTRNNSFFTEPGIFQILLNSGIFILVFLPNQCHLSERKKNLILVLLLITLMTTGSTTGYIAGGAIFVGYLLKTVAVDQRKFKRYVKRIIAIGLIALIADYILNSNTSIIQMYVMDKFLQMDNVEYASGNARLLTISICSTLLVENPFALLVGHTYYRVNQALYLTNNIAAGCKIVPLITATGIPVAIYMLYPYIFSMFVTRGKYIEKVVCFFLFWNTALTQSREMYPALIMMSVLMAWDYRNEKLELEMAN